jgi:uncharacterized protein Usg
MVDADFRLQYERGYRLTTIEVIYYRPDFNSLLQEFVWQTMDLPPQFPRIHRFLDHWRVNVQATIKDILLSTTDPLGASRYHKVDALYRC